LVSQEKREVQDTRSREVSDEPSPEEVKQIRLQIREAFEKMREIDRRIEANRKQFEIDREATMRMLDGLEARLGLHVA
jgi:hypothetical protein